MALRSLRKSTANRRAAPGFRRIEISHGSSKATGTAGQFARRLENRREYPRFDRMPDLEGKVPSANTIVSYQSLTKPFSSVDALLDITSQAARQVIADPTTADARVADVKAGLEAMRIAQGNFPQVMHTPRDATAALLQTHVAGQASAQNKLESFLLKSVDNVLEFFDVRFSQEDWLGYAVSFFTWIEDIVPAARPPAANTPEPIPNSCDLALLGDAGTGLYGAPVCAQSIATDPDGYNLLLHLGDVYYSGLPEEVQNRFLDVLKDVKIATRRSLNGNHEMYTGGHGYFETLLPAFGQTSSYFALQNDFWLLVGLDTAYKQALGGQEGVIDPDQVSWLEPILSAAGNRKVVFFTHHQPFTLLDDNHGGNLIPALGEFLDAGKVFAWYWGHEHRCVLYDRHPQYRFYGRCVGHGGFPQARPDLGNAPGSDQFGSQWRYLNGSADGSIPGGLVLDTPNLYIPGFETAFSPHGFMRLEFRNDQLTEFVRAADNANIYLNGLA